MQRIAWLDSELAEISKPAEFSAGNEREAAAIRRSDRIVGAQGVRHAA